MQDGEVAARRVGEDVHAVEVEVGAERLDVGDLPVAAVGRLVGRDRGRAGTAEVEEVQGAVGGEAAEVTEVLGGAHRAAGQTHEGRARAPYVTGQFGAVRRGEREHGVIITAGRPRGQCRLSGRVSSLDVKGFALNY